MDMNQETKVTVIGAAGLVPARVLSLLLRCLEQWR